VEVDGVDSFQRDALGPPEDQTPMHASIDGMASGPETREYFLSVQRRLAVATSPGFRRSQLRGTNSMHARKAGVQHRRVSRAEMFSSPAGLMSALASLPSVAEIDEQVYRTGISNSRSGGSKPEHLL